MPDAVERAGRRMRREAGEESPEVATRLAVAALGGGRDRADEVGALEADRVVARAEEQPFDDAVEPRVGRAVLGQVGEEAAQPRVVLAEAAVDDDQADVVLALEEQLEALGEEHQPGGVRVLVAREERRARRVGRARCRAASRSSEAARGRAPRRPRRPAPAAPRPLRMPCHFTSGRPASRGRRASPARVAQACQSASASRDAAEREELRSGAGRTRRGRGGASAYRYAADAAAVNHATGLGHRTRVAGVDGTEGGWLAVTVDNGRLESTISGGGIMDLCGSSSSRATSPSRRSTRSSTPRTRRSSAAAASTGRSTARRPGDPGRVPGAAGDALSRRAARRRRVVDDRGRPARALGDPHRRAGVRPGARPERDLAVVLRAVARDRGRARRGDGRLPADLGRRVRLAARRRAPAGVHGDARGGTAVEEARLVLFGADAYAAAQRVLAEG